MLGCTKKIPTCTKKKAGLVGCYLNVQRKSWTCCWMLSTCAKKKAGLVVGCYNLHVQRKKLDLLLDVIYITKEKAGIVQVL